MQYLTTYRGYMICIYGSKFHIIWDTETLAKTDSLAEARREIDLWVEKDVK